MSSSGICPMSGVLQFNKKSLPGTKSYLNSMIVITPQAMFTARKMITRKISILLDP
jgi:hypothetical protein